MNCFLFDLSYINCEAKAHESVAIYAMRVLDGLSKECRENITLLVAEEYAQFFKEKYSSMKILLYPDSSSLIFSIPYIRGVCKMLRWKRFVNKSRCDTIYIPFAWSGNSLAVKAKKVITIHDLRPMKEADRAFTQTRWFKLLKLKHIYLKCSRFFYGQHIKNATTIISISDYVKNDIIAEWPYCANKIKTIYNGVVLSEESICPDNNLLGINFILYVNTLSPYKNVKTLMRAYDSIRERVNCKIVIVGKTTNYWKNDVYPFIEEHHLKNIIHHITYCTNEELRWLYEHATLFVTTSTREGFGYTPIEAAICKCPVICTMAESLPEVTDNRLNYYTPPLAWNKLAELMLNILTNPIDKKKLDELSDYFSTRYNNFSQSYKIYQTLTK